MASASVIRLVETLLLARNEVSAGFFPRESARLATACQAMSERFLNGGRLLAFGRGASATDAQHVAVEFVHPVIVGKRALPALDLSLSPRDWVAALARPEDMVMGFGPPAGDRQVDAVLREAQARGAMTFALPGGEGDYALASPSADPFIHQEIVEILYHTLWETVHVFFEHRQLGPGVGASNFLYPFLGEAKQETGGVLAEVAASIEMKARDDESLRERVATDQAERIVETAAAIHGRLRAGGTLLLFGNGGSATDANDWALDCVTPLKGFRPVPAISLAMEPASLSAIANDIGPEALFLRQLIAQARPADVAVAISTSGGSANVLAALAEARKRGLLTVALLGYDGGEIARRGLADFTLVVPCDYIPRIQEIQASIYHVLLEALEAVRHGNDG
ncbi:MAG TPA: SIS domain-containing protein [Thermoanaerobaculia bacterium]|nr:SIS domain-containing protein [Thermoanaerobaculia bacterium]